MTLAKRRFCNSCFDVKDISKVAPVSTTVDLVVEVLRVSEVNPDTETTDGSKEVILVDKEVVKKAPVAAAVKMIFQLSLLLQPMQNRQQPSLQPQSHLLRLLRLQRKRRNQLRIQLLL